MFRKGLRSLLVVVVLLISHTVAFFANPYLNELSFIPVAASSDYESEGQVLSEEEAELTVIMAVPKRLAKSSDDELLEWLQNFLAPQSHATWTPVQVGEHFGYSGVAFRLRPPH